MYSKMKSIFAYNFNRQKADRPVFGGPNSAFTPCKIHDSSGHGISIVRNNRKDAFRTLKTMFGMTESVGIDNSTDATGTSQK